MVSVESIGNFDVGIRENSSQNFISFLILILTRINPIYK